MATQDLTTIDAVRRHMQISDIGDDDQDALIRDLITVASDAIMRYAQREFKTTTVGSTARSFRYDGRGILSLAPYDVRSVTSVKIDTDGADPSSTTLTLDDYRLMPIHAPDGVYHTIHLRGFNVPERSSAAQWPQFRVVEVTSSAWGFASVPGPVERAAVITATWMLRSTSQYMGDELGVQAGFNGDNVMLPGVVKRLLDPWKRQAI